MLVEWTKAVKWFYFVSVTLHIKFCQKWLSSVTYYRIYNINYIKVRRLHFKHYTFIYTLQYVCVLLPAAVLSVSNGTQSHLPQISLQQVCPMFFYFPDLTQSAGSLEQCTYIGKKHQHTTIIIQNYYPTICLKLIYFPSSFWIIITGFQFLLLMTRCKPFHHLHHCYLQFLPHIYCLHCTYLLETQITPVPSKEFEPRYLLNHCLQFLDLCDLILWQSSAVSDFFTSCIDIRTWIPSKSNSKYNDITLYLAPSWLQICIGIFQHTFCIFPCTLLALTNTCSAISQFTLQDSRMHPDMPQTIKEFAELPCTTHNSARAVGNHKNNILSKWIM